MKGSTADLNVCLNISGTIYLKQIILVKSQRRDNWSIAIMKKKILNIFLLSKKFLRKN